MKMKSIILVAVMGMAARFCSIQAQPVPGLWLSNYGGLYRATQNPSALGGSRYKWQLNLVTAGSTINNRYFIFFGRNAFLYPLLAPHSTDELYGRSRTMGSVTQKDPMYVASEIRWPSLMFSAGKNHGFAIQIRSRGFVQGQNIPKDIRTMYYRRLDTPATPVSSGEWGPFDISQQSFTEASFAYGLQLVNLRSHKLKVGATVKRVFGARAGYLQGSASRYEIRRFAGAAEDEKELVLTNFSYEAGYTHPNQAFTLGDLFDANQYGTGWGYDMGMTYELGSVWDRLEEDDDARPGYVIRVSASLTDLGSIRYQSPESRVVSGVQRRTVLRQAALETIGNQGADGFLALFRDQASTIPLNTARLPSALHLEAEVQFAKSFFVNAARTKRYGPVPGQPLDMYQPDMVTITPRFENEDSDFSLPLTFIRGNSSVSMGALARFGPIHVGFSNLNGLLNRKDPDALRATFMYVGFSVWRYKERQ